MQIHMEKLIVAVGEALDIVEGELLGASTNHGKRAAILCAAMGRSLGLPEEELRVLTAGALLHDNALTEYIMAERQGKRHDPAMKLHCEYGQRNLEALLPGPASSGVIAYHHERADGNGPFGMKEGAIPAAAELIAIADSLDVANHFQTVKFYDLPEIRSGVSQQPGKQFSRRAVKAMLSVLDDDMLLLLRDESVKDTAERLLPPWPLDMDSRVVRDFAEMVIRIIDYKSAFTRRHSSGIAEKAFFMGEYYGRDTDEKAELYLAAALHDLGKLAVPAAILEKQGSLTNGEFKTIKEHAYLTWKMLKDIKGLEDVCTWASNHHEKLDGSGYPFGKKGGELDFNSRLLACIDIYQALSEERPYHPERNHRETMEIMYDMAAKGLIDPGISADMDKAFGD
ncbi:MAG: HD domain-containing protein [Treponema sp.]|jgi:HD-GYP domain-containing protein (c-di-GMP phosphodiesterase class II)|nr:HD domain-containing protein [Treponema sp.]